MPHGPEEQLSPAAEAFAQFLARVADGESVDFDAFCEQHPEESAKLRRMHANWRELSEAWRDDETPPPTLRPRAEHGEGTDSGITVDTVAQRATTPGDTPAAGAGSDESTSGLLEDLRRGSRASRYKIRDEIARGGMGAILKVWDGDLRRNMAMKVLLEQRGEDGQWTVDPRTLSRFLEEAQITGQLHHPGVVPVYELGLDNSGRVYFTMPLVRGKNLQEIIDLVRAGTDGWSLTRALGVIVQVCEAVGYAHSRGVVHRDLKPANIMVGSFGETYVMDWGLARVLSDEESADARLAVDAVESVDLRTVRKDLVDQTPSSPLATMDGDLVGTPVYMPPEQAGGRMDQVGPKSDVYSIGAMLYHVLTGQRPYLTPGMHPAPRAVARAVLSGPPKRVHELDASVPAELEAICDRAMARNAADRYAGTMEMAADLRAFLEGRVVLAHRVGPLVEAHKWVQRNKGFAAAVVGAVLVLVAGLVFSLIERRRANEQMHIAESNLDTAYGAIDEMLGEVTTGALTDIPQAALVRKRILKSALNHYLNILRARPDDTSVRARIMVTYRSLAWLHTQLGESGDANDAFSHAVAFAGAVLAVVPGHETTLLELARARGQQGRLAYQLGEFDAATTHYREALAILERSDAWSKVTADAQMARAIVLGDLGRLLMAQRRTSEALQPLREAVEIQRAVYRDNATPNSLGGLATSFSLLAWAHNLLGQLVEAESASRDAISHFEEFLAARPTDRPVRQGLAQALVTLGETQRLGKELVAAEQTLVRAVDVFRGVVADHPRFPAGSSGLATALASLGRIEQDRGKRRAALKRFEEAIHNQNGALKITPGNAVFRRLNKKHYEEMLDSLRANRAHRQIAQRVDAFVVDATKSGDVSVAAAEYMAVCVKLAGQDFLLADDERKALEADYGRRAIKLLDQAVARGFANARLIREDADFRVLRGRPELVHILAKMDSASVSRSK